MKSIRLLKNITKQQQKIVSLQQNRQFSLVVKYASYGNPIDVLK